MKSNEREFGPWTILTLTMWFWIAMMSACSTTDSLRDIKWELNSIESELSRANHLHEMEMNERNR